MINFVLLFLFILFLVCLKSPHFSGKMVGLVTGTVRVANLIDSNFSNPSMTIILKKSIKSETEAEVFGLGLVRSYFKDICSRYPSYELTGGYCRIKMYVDRSKCINRMVTLHGAVQNVCEQKQFDLSFDLFDYSFMDEEIDFHLQIDIPLGHGFWKEAYKSTGLKNDCGVNDRLVADNMTYNLFESTIINGLPGISNFIVENIMINTELGKSNRWSVVTLGSNLRHILRLPEVDSTRTVSNNVSEMNSIFGIYAARKALENEFGFVLSDKADSRHIKLICRMMASDLIIKGMKIKQVAHRIPPTQRASYEKCSKQMTEYCALGETDGIQTICAAALTNTPMKVGTGFCMKVISIREEVEIPDRYLQQWKNIPSKICEYIFSPKADGTRYFMVFYHNQNNLPLCALINRARHIFELPIDDIPDMFFHGTVLDVEMVTNNSNETCIMVFDCLSICGNKSAVLRYDERLELAREVIYRINTLNMSRAFTGKPINLPVIPMVPALRPEVSSNICRLGTINHWFWVKPIYDMVHLKMFNSADLFFKSDGYVMTNLFAAAQPFRIGRNDIFKWKPRTAEYSENTIDFIVYPVKNNSYYLPWPTHLTTGFTLCQMERFRDTGSRNKYALWITLPDYQQFNFSTAFPAHDISGEIKTSSVYECRYNFYRQSWEIMRIRHKDPNNYYTVIATLCNIVEDIQINEL